MNMKNITAKAAAAVAFGLVATVPAFAQSSGLIGGPSLSFRSTTHQGSNTLLLVSGGVLLIGLLDNNSTLAVLGGAGVLYSLSQSGQLGYRTRPGLGLVKMGDVSLGFNSAQMGTSSGTKNFKPYVQVTTKF